MGPWVLREEGRGATPGCAGGAASLAFHPPLNVVLAANGATLSALDVNSGAVLLRATPGDTGDPVGVQYLPGADRIVIWNVNALGVRSDYNGVLLLHTALQRPLRRSAVEPKVKIELFLSEAILLYQCMRTVEFENTENASLIMSEFEEAIKRANESPKKGIKAQKWSTICLELPHNSLKMMTFNIVSELKRQKRHIPALAIASALNQQVSELMSDPVANTQSLQESQNREIMFSEAVRRETFKKWPHMDYKWALPAQMAQAGFFYQPTVSGDDRAMCFSCGVCLVCWEKTDEPWSEHERHSPDCPLVKGEYTHNVPLSATYATNPAVSHPDVSIISKGNSGNIFLTASTSGKVSIWNVDCKLKLQQEFLVSIDETVIQSKLYGPYSNVRKAWENSNDKKAAMNLTSLALIGRCQNREQPCSKIQSANAEDEQTDRRCSSRPSIVCSLKVNTVCTGKGGSNIWRDADSKVNVRTDRPSESATSPNDDVNNSKSNNINSCYLVVYDFQGKCSQTVSPLTNTNGNVCVKNGTSKSGGSKKCEGITHHTCRTEDGNIYDDIYLSKYLFNDDDMSLSKEMAFMAGLQDQATVIDFKSLVTPLTKDLESKFGPSDKTVGNIGAKGTITHCIEFFNKPPVTYTFHPVCEDNLLDQYVVEANGEKTVKCYDFTNIKIPNEALDIKTDTGDINCVSGLMYEYKNSGIKMKVPYYSQAIKNVSKSSSSEPSNKEALPKDLPVPLFCRAIQCVQLPPEVAKRNDLTISHVMPTIDGDFLLVVVTCESASQSPVSLSDKENIALINGIINGYNQPLDMCNIDSDLEIYNVHYRNVRTSFLILYSLKFDSTVTLINETPVRMKEIPYTETPSELCLLPNLEKGGDSLGLAATVGYDGALRLLDIKTLMTLAEARLEASNFVSATFCTSIEKVCVCTDDGSLYFYAVRDSEDDSAEELDEEEAFLCSSESNFAQQIDYKNMPQTTNPPPSLIAHKSNLDRDDLNNLVQLAGLNGKGDNVVAYTAVVPSCWCELLPTQRSRADNQHFYRSWRLQNTASTWDEHILELTLPFSLSVSHVELKFTLHSPCNTPPNIQVTLLKQHLQNIGQRRESPKYFTKIDDQIDFSLIDSEPKGTAENPVRSREYLRAHNAEILAGPVTLAQDLDLTQQAGTLTLTSPLLYRARGRTLLIHIKTLFDPSKEMNQGKVCSSKKNKSESENAFVLPGSTVERFIMPSKKKVESYIGCDWLHEISVTIRNNKQTGVPHERLQRIAMLESPQLFDNLLTIATDNANKDQSIALDLLIWIVSIRLTRFRGVKAETVDQDADANNMFFSTSKTQTKTSQCHKNDMGKLQQETIKVIQSNIVNLVKKCILLSKRSISKKCAKLILICCKGAKNYDDDMSLQFEMAILESVVTCLPLIGIVQSAGSLGWFIQLMMRSVSLDFEMRCATICMQLLKDIASIMKNLYNPYHLLLRSRFGLYGLPMESNIFDVDLPILGKASSVPLTYSSIVAGDASTTQLPKQPEIDLRDLYNYTGKGSSGWWLNESSVCGNIAGLSEVMPLRVSFHSASDGTHLDTANNQQSCPSLYTIHSDNPQLWDHFSTNKNPDQDNSDTTKNNEQEDKVDSVIENEEQPIKMEEDEIKYTCNNGLIPWQILVQQPPHQTFVIKRMHPGARHFIVLDFGYPVKLTDMIIPACPEVVTLSVDVWLNSEEQDSTRLVLAPDLSAKNLVMTNIQPPLVVQYLKITTIGRYNMSTTRCKIPLGWFYGEVADSVIAQNKQANINNLIALHQDLNCKFRLAVGKLTDCLDFYLESSGVNSAQLTIDQEQQNENYPHVKMIYQECLEIQQQINTVERIMERLEIFKRGSSKSNLMEDFEKMSPAAVLKQASLDKLKTITEQLTDILLYICLECESTSLKRFISTINMSTCALVTRWLIICGGGGGPRLEAALASVLVRLCSSQPWWGSFIADTLAQLYSPSNTLIFSQNRVLILLVYMGRKSLHFEKPLNNCGGSVIECVSQLITQLLPQSSDNTTPSNMDPIWQATDLALLGWLLVFLSACLDSDNLREGSNSWARWSFLSGKSGNSGSNNLANNAGGAMKGSAMSINRFNRRKYQKKIVHKIYMDELESVRKAYQASQQVQALSTLSSQAANLSHHSGTIVYHPMKNQDCFYKISSKNLWVKRFEEFIQSRFSSLNKLVAGYSGNSSGGSSRMTGNAAGSSSDQEVLMGKTRPTQLISQHLALQVSRSLISLILSMDFTCNTDILLLACKVIGRLNGLCGGLSSIVKEQEILELMNAACSPSPWHQHALLMLLQDLIEYERVGFKNESSPSTSNPVIPNDSGDDGMQWHNTAMTINSFTNSDNRTDAIPIEMIAPTSYTINKEDSTSASASADYLMESDEEYDVEDLLDEVAERTKLSQKDIVIKNPYTTLNGASIAIDARLGSGLEICGEVLVRRLALLGGGSLAAAINSQPLPMIGTFNSTPPTEQLVVNSNTDLTTMLCNCFHSLFISPDLQDNNAKLESMLQLWITLNGSTCGVSSNNSSTIPDSLLTPKIKLTNQAVYAIIHALNQQINVSIRCWVLAFQCLSWIANSVNDSRDSPSAEGMAGVMIEEPQFIEMIVKFLSLNVESDSFTRGGDKPCVGPIACGTMTCLLTRISSRAPAASKIAFLRALCQLTSPGGAMRNGRGPADAQRELLIIINSFSRQYNHSHLPEAMSLIDSIGVIINSMSNSVGVEVHGVVDMLSTVSSVDLGGVVGGLGGLLAEALGVGSDSVKREKPTCRRELMISLIMFAKTLLTIPLRDMQANESNVSTSEESQTDESKASQQSSGEGSSNASSSRVPCLTDTVLQHHPTMRRIFKALSTCSSLSTQHKGIASNNEYIFGDHPLFGDALFKFVLTLVQTTTHPRLILVPLVEYLGSGSLSDPMIRFITRALEMPNALEIFASLGGIEIICVRLISSHKSQLSPQPGLIAALMNHLKPVQVANLSSTQSDKQPVNVECGSGLFNYAPLGTIGSSNPTAQTAEALISVINNGNGNCGTTAGGGGAHRRARSAAWSHHFSRGDTSVDLCIKLPHAILLHEVQLQPHLSTSSTCPSAVSLEVCTQGCVMTPLGPPQLTAGMTYIRLRLVNPLIVNAVLVRLYKPRDSSTLGLLNMRILGSSAFNTTIFDKLEEKLASTSAGWALILWQCLCGSENEIQINARRRASCIAGLVEALSGLFLSSSIPSSTLKSLLLLLGSETPTTLRVLSLILYNGHIPAHQVSRNTSKSPVDSVCNLLYQLCIIQDSHSMQRLKTFIDWLKDCGESVISRLRSGSSHQGTSILNLNPNTKYLNPVYVQCLAAVLWYAKEQHFDYDLKGLITDDLFDMICAWIEVLPMHTHLKRSLNSVLCSACYIRPELFSRMLNKMGVFNNDICGMHIEESISDDSKDLVAKEALTDDTKVYRENNHNTNPSIDPVNLTPSQLMTISATCMSPEAIKVLLKSNILINITKAIEKFCNTYKTTEGESPIMENPLTDSDKADNKVISLEMMPTFIEWLSSLCIDAEIKDWLGGPVGSCFLKPLLMILCVSDYDSKCSEKNVLMTQLEEKTIKLFNALTSCHTLNRYLFAQILFDVIKSYQEIVAGVGTSIGGFLCRLLLRLLLRNEQISVGIRIKGDSVASKDSSLSFYSKLVTNGTLPPHYLSSHPSLYGCILLSLPHQTQLSDILQHLLLNGNAWPTNNSSVNNNHAKKSTVASNLIEAGSSHQGNTSAIDAWELSVAAANTAKDKRTKDARNLCAKQAMLQCKKKLSRRVFTASGKKEDLGSSSVFNTNVAHDTLSSDNLKISVDGLDGYVSPNANLGVLSASTLYKFGPNLNININSINNNDITETINEQHFPNNVALSNPSLLSIFASIGGLALLAHHLPPICPPVPLPSQPNKEITNVEEWVKLDDVYEDVAAEASSNSTNEESSSIVPTHSLVALGLLLRLPSYAEALLKEGQRAVHLLRLLLGVTDDGEGKEIMAVCGPGLGTLSFRVLGSLLESLPLSTDDGMLLRYNLVQSGTLRLLLLCLAVFTHQQPESPPSESNQNNGTFTKSKAEEKSKLYWAKGTGFGTGSTQQSWNVEESLLRQRTEEEHVTVLLQVIASYIHPGEFWNIGDSSSPKTEEEVVKQNISDDTNANLPPEFFNIIHQSALLSAVSSYLRNDSVLDMSRHIPLYLAVMKVVRAIMTCQSLCLQQNSSMTISSSLAVIPPLLHQMSFTVNTYATKLKMNKKTAFSKTATTTTDGCEDDEGLALLIPDIQATSALVQKRLGMNEASKGLANLSAALIRPPSTATREARYLEVMKRLQFETFEMIGDCGGDKGYKFNVSYHFEATVRAAGEHSHPARMKRLAQEAVTLSTSLPLSYSSSVFVRTDQDRLDIMKVLITGPSDTPYANGCFELDVYFPIEYPNTPMLINLETTGKHSVRFNPNLYIDGKVCLSVLNTWHGRPEEQWNAQTSSFLQVLVSIQSLILVPEPYFNEPGFERSRGTPGGTNHSLEYNSNIYQACVRWAMLEQLRNPTSCFQQVIQTHFWLKRDEICTVIEAWIEELETQSGDKRTQRNIKTNMIALKRHYKSLREELAKLKVPPGLEDLETPFDEARASSDSPAPSSPDVDIDQFIKKIVSQMGE